MSQFFSFFDLGFSTILLQREDVVALGQGLLLGDDSYFSSSLKQLSRSAGVSHLVAASGANLHFAAKIGSLVTPKQRRSFGEVSRVLSIAVYLFLAGWSGSLWRAAVAFSVQFVCRIGGVRVPFVTTALLTIIISVGWWEDLGFWLSFIAIFGLNFSQNILPGEKNIHLLPKELRCLNYGWRELSVGVWVTFFVSFLLLVIFGWQSIVWLSPLATFVSSWFTPAYAWITLILVLLEQLSNKVAFLFNGLWLTAINGLLTVIQMTIWLFLVTWWQGVKLVSLRFPLATQIFGLLLLLFGPGRQTHQVLRERLSYRQWKGVLW